MKFIVNIFKKNNEPLILTLIGCIIIISQLLLINFIFPQTDDYWMTQLIKKHNGFINFQKWFYYNWTGRYFQNIFGYFTPKIMNNINIYRFVILLYNITFISSIFLLFKKVLWKFSKKSTISISIIFYIFYLILLQNTSELFYWFTGITTYTTSIILTVFLLISLNNIVIQNKKKYKLYTFILLAGIIGCNETSFVLIGGIILLYSFFTFKEHKRFIATLLAILIIFGIITITAPGNFVRKSDLAEKKELSIIFINLLESIVNVVRKKDWYIVLLYPFLIYPFAIEFNRKYKIQSPIPKKLFLLLPIIVLLVGLFPSFYSVGFVRQRTFDVIAFYFLITLTFAVLINFSKSNLTILKLRLFILPLFIIWITITNNTCSTFIKDLVYGGAKKHKEEMLNRVNIMRNSKTDTCYVPKLKAMPKSIIRRDLGRNPTLDRDFALFHQKKMIYEKK